MDGRMNKNPEVLVSVVMPVYNAEKYLRPCLDSVVHQTLDNLEIICVDDGSTDSSLKILEEYAAKDPRITILQQKNQYAGVARNNGMAHAHGKYIIFWDADDYFDTCALEKLTAQAEKHQAQITICGADSFDDENKILLPTERYMDQKRVPEEQPFNKKQIGRYLYNFSQNVPWNKLFLRSFAEEQHFRFQNLQQANDVYFVMLALFRAERIAVVKEHLITYRVFNMDSLTGKSWETGFCTARAFESVFDELSREPEFTDDIRQSFANKSVGPLINAWRAQNDGESAEKLYGYYKEILFPKFGLYGRERSYFNNDVDYCRIKKIEESDNSGFMLYEMRSFRKQLTQTQGKLALCREELHKNQCELKRIKSNNFYKVYHWLHKIRLKPYRREKD